MKYFNTKQEYETYVLGGLKSGDACYVAEDNSVHFRTNNVDGTSQTYNVNGGSSAAVLIDGEFNENGVYEPEDADGYAKVTVDVQPNLTTETITENGTYTPTDFDGYSSVTVNVPTGGDDNLIKDMISGDLTSIVIPNGITKINIDAFSHCQKLTSVNIPNSVTSINNGAFESCSRLSEITIPNSVTYIGVSAFNQCTGLTNITIPASVTSIGDMIFFMCSKLSTIIVEPTTPPKLGSSAFSSNASGRKIYVPDESVDAYKAASNWSTYADDILPMSELS